MRMLDKSLIKQWPVASPAVRRELVRQLDMCPDCSGALTINWKCYDCDRDASALARQPPVPEPAE